MEQKTRYGLEVWIVLFLGLGRSAVYSLLSIVERLTRPDQPLAQQTTQLNTSTVPDRPWLDLSYQLAGMLFPLVQVLLVLYLVHLSHQQARRLLGLDLRCPARDLGYGLGLAAGIGVPGLGFYLAARELGVNTRVEPANLAEHWWTVPVLVGLAVMNGLVEEVIVLGYLLLRLQERGWAWWVVVVTSALVRGSYHLYQGFGGFAGNIIMGVVFALAYRRLGRVMPFVVAHALIDIVAFVGYALARPYLTWL